jgi:hypothetical protein
VKKTDETDVAKATTLKIDDDAFPSLETMTKQSPKPLNLTASSGIDGLPEVFLPVSA